MDEEKKMTIEFEVDTSSLSEVEKRIERMAECLDKAVELAESIASTKINIGFDAIINDSHTNIGKITRTVDDVREKIRSLHFDADLERLEINGKKFERAIIVRWPESLNDGAWKSGLLINESKEEGLKRFERREELPVLEIAFKDGTGGERRKDGTR